MKLHHPVSCVPRSARFAGGCRAMLGAFACMALACCASSNVKARSAVARTSIPQPVLYDWHPDTASGPATVNVVLNEQKAYIYRGGKQVGWTYLASGVSGHDTPTGTFSVMEKNPQKHSETYGSILDSSGTVIDSDAMAGREPIPPGGRFAGAPMPYWMRLTGDGVGLHAGAIPQPGYPASHGCIRLPAVMAARLYDVVDVGTKVIVTHDAPAMSDQLTAGAE